MLDKLLHHVKVSPLPLEPATEEAVFLVDSRLDCSIYRTSETLLKIIKAVRHVQSAVSAKVSGLEVVGRRIISTSQQIQAVWLMEDHMDRGLGRETVVFKVPESI